MNSKKLFIYESYKLFEILKEIKDYLSFEIHHIDKTEYKKLDFKKFNNYLIISTNNNDEIKDCLKISNFPKKISNLLEIINQNFLKNQYSNQSNIKIGKYILNLNSRKIYLKSKSLDLTEKESNLILFISSKKKVNLKDLQKNVWGYSSNLETHTVETHIYRLRKKILEIFKDNNFINHDKYGYFID
ncbi:response regulator transcription factor [Pelagibacterales bacterium SAG-MED43]|nr:response regulator transcription factor [Pelagibacterales bacterium SAG-MED43]